MFPWLLCQDILLYLVQASVAWRQNTMDVAQQNVSSALSAILASTAAIVTLTGTGDPSDINYTAAGAAVTTMLVTSCNP